MKYNSTIMAVLIDKRTDAAPKVQEILTKYGCIISSRIGLHQTGNCADEGLIILHISSKDGDVNKLEEELKAVHRVKVEKMEVGFDD